MSVRNLEHLFRPQSVAVIGASERERSVGAVVMRNLREGGFGGPLWPVNPKHKRIGDLRAWPSVDALPQAPDLAVICTDKIGNVALGQEAGLKVGMSGGFIVDGGMHTSVDGVYAAGDCVEVPHGVSNVPIQGLSGSHAYAQGKVAGANAAGGSREYQPVYVPWGMVAGKWMIGGVSFSETLATALGIPYVVGTAQGITRARYYPDSKIIKVKLLAEPEGLRLIGAQIVGVEGVKERADFLAMAVRTGITLNDLATMEHVYSPPIGALGEPIAAAAQNALASLAR